MVTLANTFEGVASGTTITPANSASGGSPFDTVTIGTGAVVMYSTNEWRGSNGALFSSGLTSAQASCDWTTSLGAGITHSYGRTYFQNTSNAIGVDFIRQRSTSIQAFRFRINNTGRLEFRDTANSIVGTSTTVFSVNTWYLIRWDVLVGSSSTGVVYIHTDPTSATPTETLTATAANFGTANIVSINVGGPAAAAASISGFYHDDVVATDVALPSLSIQTVTLSESQTSADAVSRNMINQRAKSESQTASDVIARKAVLARNPSDGTSASDAMAKQLIFARSLSEAQTASDVMVSKLVRTRTPSEVLSTSDAIGVMNLRSRAVSEGQASSDAVQRFRIITKPISETVSSSDSAGRTVVVLRASTESTTSTDTVVRTDIASRASSESLSTSDATAVQKSLHVFPVESNTSTDTASRQIVMVRSASDVVTGSDQISQAFGLSRAISEVVTGSDTVARQGLLGRALPEVTSVSDNVVTQKSVQRSVGESVTGADAVSCVGMAFRSPNELTAVSDSIAGKEVLVRPVTEATMASDVVTVTSGDGQIRTVTETLSTTDSVQRAGRFNRTATEAVTGVDSTIRATLDYRAGGEAHIASDSVISNDIFQRAIGETVSTSDAASFHRLLQRFIAESGSTLDLLQVVRNFRRSIAEPLSTRDSVVTATPGALSVDINFGTIRTKWNFVAIAGRRLPQLYGKPVSFKEPLPKWDIDWGSVMYAVPAISREYIRVPVTAQGGGFFINPTGMPVAMAFMVTTDSPGQSDWQSATWDQMSSPTFTYVIQCLIGPTAVELTAGIYNVWVQISDTPELIQRPVGTLTITQGIV